MGLRNVRKNYRWPGTYHITINVFDRKQQPLGRVVGDTSKPDGDPMAPKVLLSTIGQMVEHELLNSIKAYYPMVEVQDYVIMPEHLHFLVFVHRDIFSTNGRETHLGHVIAGFKKGCNRRYWEITGQSGCDWQGKPALASSTPASSAGSSSAGSSPAGSLPAGSSPAGSSSASISAVRPQGSKVPSDGSTGRQPLFGYGYVDVMPLKEGQLERQREYIRNNPRYRLLRMNNHKLMHTQRNSVPTALTLNALKGYLQRECGATLFNEAIWEKLQQRLLTEGNNITCDSYGNSLLLNGNLLPVVCHRKDSRLFDIHKSRCLTVAASGTVLVSARIAKGELDIIDSAISLGYPVVTISDNGFHELYHPSEQRMNLCSDNKLLIVSPWEYHYRHSGESLTVAECKAMNCIVQAICRTKDSWWKE